MEDIARLSKEANLAYLHLALFTVQSGQLSTSGVLMRQKLVGP